MAKYVNNLLQIPILFNFFYNYAVIVFGYLLCKDVLMIVLDTDLTTLLSKLNVSYTKMVEMYSMMSVEDIVEAEAAQGNQAAVEYATELFSNPDKLVEIFNLADPNNKFLILSTMTSDKLQKFLPLMEEEDLQQGLYFFTEDKLLAMLKELPPEQLVNTVMEMFSEEEVIRLMPNSELDNFLTSTDVDKGNILKHLQSIPPEYLAQMIEGVTGQECQDKSNFDMVKQIDKFNPLEFKDALYSMQSTQKQQLTLNLANQHPELYQLFSPEAYTNMIHAQKQKPELVKAMHVIEPEEKIKMVEELPNDLLSMVITQIDARDFADSLINKFPEVLAEIIAG